MKRIVALLLSSLTIILFPSCEKETILSVDQTSVSFSDVGGGQSVLLTANKTWTASSNQSWCRVSPSAGESASSSRITITCEPNKTYDARNASVTFTCAEKTVIANIIQAVNDGLLVSKTKYNVTNAEQQLEIEVQSNVRFSVEVDSDCKTWISLISTKGLTNSTVILDIDKNKSYDKREGKVTVKQDNGNLSATIFIEQDQVDGLFVATSEYVLSSEKQNLTIDVNSNIGFDVISSVDWIKHIETKGLNTNQIVLGILKNDSYNDREGLVTLKQKNGELSRDITISQCGQSLDIKKIKYSEWSSFHDEVNLVYDEDGRVIKTLFSPKITYTGHNDSTVIGIIENGYYSELSIINNLCLTCKYKYESQYSFEDLTTSNHYLKGRLIKRETSGVVHTERIPYSRTEDFVWDNDNLVSWIHTYGNEGSTYNRTYEYYDYKNPWESSMYDFSSAYLLEDDWDEFPMEMFFGFTGLHSKNLLKASLINGKLYQTFEYAFDNKGRISKVTVRTEKDFWGNGDTREYWYVYELFY